jgi:hypothetical protein
MGLLDTKQGITIVNHDLFPKQRPAELLIRGAAVQTEDGT